MDKTVNPLTKYLEKKGENRLAFSRKCKVPATTIYSICGGRIPNRATAIQICRHTDGEITPEDFGWVREIKPSAKNRFIKNIHRSKIIRTEQRGRSEILEHGRNY